MSPVWYVSVTVANCLVLSVATSASVVEIAAFRFVFCLRFTKTLTCCSDAAISPATNVGCSAVPATLSSVVTVGIATRNFSGVTSGRWTEKDGAVNSSGAVMTLFTLLPLPSESTEPSTVSADATIASPSSTIDSSTPATCNTLVTIFPVNTGVLSIFRVTFFTSFTSGFNWSSERDNSPVARTGISARPATIVSVCCCGIAILNFSGRPSSRCDEYDRLSSRKAVSTYVWTSSTYNESSSGWSIFCCCRSKKT